MQKKIKIQLFIFLLSFLSFKVFPQEINITGKVLDKSGNPMFGVIATLKNSGLSDTTGSDGIYLLYKSNTSIGMLQNGYYLKPKIDGQRLMFSVKNRNQKVLVELYNITGRKITTVLNENLFEGNYSFFPISYCKQSLSFQMYVIKLKIGNEISYHKVLNIFQQKNSLLNYHKIANPVLARRIFASDTLNLVKDEQLLKSSVINDFIDTLPELYIVQRDIYGKLLSSANSIGKIKAVITGDSIPDSIPKIVELWYNSVASSYSGFVYFIYYLNVVNYNVYINVFNSSGKFIGRSVNVPFNSMAGDVQIPDFNPGNAIPIANAGNDTTVSINDLIKLHGSALDSFSGTIIKWEWNINGVGFVETSGGDTNLVAPNNPVSNYLCKLQVTDNDSNVSTDDVIINIIQDIPIANAGKDSAIHMNSLYTFKGSASQQFGSIVKWEWNIGNSNFVETSSGDTIITSPSVYVSSYPCILKVTDDDNNIDLDTMYLTIGKWELLGIEGFSAGVCDYISLAVENSIPYVSYRDRASKDKLTVMKFDGNNWLPVGNSGFTDSAAWYSSITLTNGIPYVAFSDYSRNTKASVMKFDGNNWVYVGNSGFSTSEACFGNIIIDNGTPYVSYMDVGAGDDDKATVMKFDGNNWVAVGLPRFSKDKARNPRIAKYGDSLFISFYGPGGVNNFFATVMKFNGSTWDTVGNSNIAGGPAPDVSLALDNFVPYIVFRNGNPGPIRVMKFDNEYWVNVGDPDISGSSNVGYPSIRIYNNTPYVAYQISGANVKKYDGNTWEFVGKANFGYGNYLSLVIDNGNFYVVFCNSATKATVMKLM